MFCRQKHSQDRRTVNIQSTRIAEIIPKTRSCGGLLIWGLFGLNTFNTESSSIYRIGIKWIAGLQTGSDFPQQKPATKFHSLKGGSQGHAYICPTREFAGIGRGGLCLVRAARSVGAADSTLGKCENNAENRRNRRRCGAWNCSCMLARFRWCG